MSNIHAVVVGGGIIGLSTALRALQTIPGIRVTIVAEKLTPHTTGDGAAGFWSPYLFGDTDEETIRFWCAETFTFLCDLARIPDASAIGVGFLSAYHVDEKEKENPYYSDTYLHFRDLTEKELSLFPQRFRYGKFFTTIYTEGARLLPYLIKKFKELGGEIIQARISSLTELADKCDVIMNCPGVEAHHLVPDNQVYPIRGQVIRVYAPWIKHAVTSPDFHILPNSTTVVCGGTHQKGDWNTNPDPQDRERIWKGCCELVPSLKGAKLVKEWVGLRPGRAKPRIESETIESNNGKQIKIIHNYGHGGSGLTIFWGCAKNAVELLDEAVSEIQRKRLVSSL